MPEFTPISSFSDNYIWQIREYDNPVAAIVDPGDATPVLRALDRAQITPAAILLTHHHNDHVGGVPEIKARYPDIPVFGPARELIPGVTHPVKDDQRITIPSTQLSFRVLDIPGHTKGHVAYYGYGALFCGDTLFSVGCGRLFEGTPDQMYASLQKIAALPIRTLLYCAHEYTLENIRFAKQVEPENFHLAIREHLAFQQTDLDMPTVPTLLVEELGFNPFLRCNVPEVIHAAEHYVDRKLANPTDVFTVLRHWKDNQ